MSAESNAHSHAEAFRWWQGDPEITPEVAELRDLAALRDAVADQITAAAVTAHDSGLSWTVIGEALGITRQAAQKRLGRVS